MAPVTFSRKDKIAVLIAGGLFLLLMGSPAYSQTLAFGELTPEFGVVSVGKSTEFKIISISNVSSDPIFITNITTTPDFANSNMCPMWLAEGSGCLVFVWFSPSEPGVRSGKLRVSWAGGGEQLLPLSGVALPQESDSGPPPTEELRRTSNDEENAYALLNDRRYTFEALLKKNPADVANQKRIFSLTKNTKLKERIASILLSIGISDQNYFTYLADEAEKALVADHDIPRTYLYAEDGDPIAINPVLNDWCEKHDIPFWDAHNMSTFEMPTSWYFLAAARDPQAYDLLIRGLHSTNVMISTMAAEGLAMLQDPKAVEQLISAGRSAPEVRGGISKALLSFADPKAQAAAEDMLPEKDRHLIELWRGELKEKGLKAFFPW